MLESMGLNYAEYGMTVHYMDYIISLMHGGNYSHICLCVTIDCGKWLNYMLCISRAILFKKCSQHALTIFHCFLGFCAAGQ